MTARKTVLIVDDDAGILRVLSDGLSSVLDLFDVVTASNGQEAIHELERRSIDVLVTDLAMPVMDGFALIAYVTNRRSALPVVVLSGMVGSMLDQRLAGYGGLRVLRKPASYQEVATCVLEEIERVDRGLIEGIPLSGVLQLVEAERRSCRVVVTSGRRRGHLDFESGRLINAFSDDFGAEGEAAAYDILGWSDTAIEFAPLPAHVRRVIHTPMQLLLVELAAVQDRGADRAVVDPEAQASDEPSAAPDDAHEPPAVADVAFAATPDGDAGEPRDDAADVPTDALRADADAPAETDEPAGVDDTLLLDDPPPVVATEAATEAATEPQPEATEDVPRDVPAETPAAAVVGATDAAGTGVDEAAAARSGVGPAHPTPALTDAPNPAGDDEGDTPPPSPPANADAHVQDMLTAIERLAQRAQAADEALAAVAAEIDAFREAQRRFDDELAQRERRRRDLERFRDEVGQLAREILGRVDGLFDAMAGDVAPRDAGGERPPT